MARFLACGPLSRPSAAWIDGGSCSAANAGLGAHYDKVVVIAPVIKGFPGQRGTLDEVADLKAAGVDVVLIRPDERASAAIGVNGSIPRAWSGGRTGPTQGQSLATEVLGVGVALMGPTASSIAETRRLTYRVSMRAIFSI